MQAAMQLIVFLLVFLPAALAVAPADFRRNPSLIDLYDKLALRVSRALSSCRQPSAAEWPVGRLFTAPTRAAMRLHRLAEHYEARDDRMAAVACVLEALHRDSSRAARARSWVYLGWLSGDDACFEAAKGKADYEPLGDVWETVGPFVAGKMEFDGDPLAAYGGVGAVLDMPWQRTGHVGARMKAFHSEYVRKGARRRLNRADADGSVRIAYDDSVAWNDLVPSLSSQELLEYHAWVATRIVMHSSSAQWLHCTGLRHAFVDGEMVVGDVYQGGSMRQLLQLSRGVHVLSARVKIKHSKAFRCRLMPADSETRLLQPEFTPDLFSDAPQVNTDLVLGLPIRVGAADVVITGVVVDGRHTALTSGPITAVAGQHLRLPCRVPRPVERCRSDVLMRVRVALLGSASTTNEVVLVLKCRATATQSFVFGFEDADGSPAHAAALTPRSCGGGGGGGGGEGGVLLAFGGTGTSVRDMADAFKVKRDGEFCFGVKGAFVLVPGRFGAHNHEGIGDATAVRALEALVELVGGTVRTDRLFVTGHSMGGHGALSFATKHAQQVVCVAAVAGWLRKETYGDSNALFVHDVAAARMDAQMKSSFEAAVVDSYVDLFADNLVGKQVLLRVGERDRTVHPWWFRRFARTLAASTALRTRQDPRTYIRIDEVRGKEHWWWDTVDANDGGVVNDRKMRRFYHKKCVRKAASPNVESGHTATTVFGSPALFSEAGGIRLLQQQVPLAVTRFEYEPQNRSLHTTNAQMFSLTQAFPLFSSEREAELRGGLSVDGDRVPHRDLVRMMSDPATFSLCRDRLNRTWQLCNSTSKLADGERGPRTYPPARNVFLRPFVIVYGILPQQRRAAVVLANLFEVAFHTYARVVPDTGFTCGSNALFVGDRLSNAAARLFVTREPVQLLTHPSNGTTSAALPRGYRLGDHRTFEGRDVAAAYTVPLRGGHLGLVLSASSHSGLQLLLELAQSTIPPMVRAPFSNLLADYIVLDARARAWGIGGALAHGVFDNFWSPL